MVPIVPGAVIFDLPVGVWNCRPTAEFGYAACETAGTEVAVGTVGAGVGARTGVLKGGVGTSSTVLPSGVTVGAVVIVNCAGDVVDRNTGLPWMAELVQEFGLRSPPRDQIDALGQLARDKPQPLNTTIAVVATDAALSSTATPSSRWPLAPSRYHRRRMRSPGWPRRRAWSRRWAPPPTAWPAPRWAACWRPNRSRGSRPTGVRCRARSREGATDVLVIRADLLDAIVATRAVTTRMRRAASWPAPKGPIVPNATSR